MRPPWSVILFTTLAGAGQGLFLAVFFAGTPDFVFTGSVASLMLLATGLAASFFHLGRPERAWRTAAMWRTSWLSREVIVLPLLMALVFVYALTGRTEVGWAAALASVALFVCTGMIYACLPFLQEWRTPLTVLNFTALGCASGLTGAVALAAWLEPQLTTPFITAALAVGTVAYFLRILSLIRNVRLRPKSTTQSAIGVRAAEVRQISQGAMGGSYNTREFFHHQPGVVVRGARWTLLLLLFPVPALILMTGNSAVEMSAACLVQYAGLLAERWYFFAEAKHPQNLYYQAIA
jgi:sulfite dehydrogenase (quinone) subunit SoeC